MSEMRLIAWFISCIDEKDFGRGLDQNSWENVATNEVLSKFFISWKESWELRSPEGWRENEKGIWPEKNRCWGRVSHDAKKGMRDEEKMVASI